MRFVETSNYDHHLNDAIRRYNRLDYWDKCKVLGGLAEVRQRFLEYNTEDKAEILSLMNSSAEERNKSKKLGPGPAWVLAAFKESLCQMLLSDEKKAVLEFYSNPYLSSW